MLHQLILLLHSKSLRCTLDAIGQLASVIDKKSLQVDDSTPVCKPVLIAMCDQFGIAHAPFAQGRSFLTERGYGDCKVLIHQQRHGKKPNDENDEGHSDLRLVEVSARYVFKRICFVCRHTVDAHKVILLFITHHLCSDLAPSPPDMFGKVISKNHYQGLQLEF
jgi:hypothetical protein